MPNTSLTPIYSFNIDPQKTAAASNTDELTNLRAGLAADPQFHGSEILINLGVTLAFCLAIEERMRAECKSRLERSQVKLHKQVDLWGAVDAYSKLFTDYFEIVNGADAKSAGALENEAFAEALWRCASECFDSLTAEILRNGQSETFGNLINQIQTLINRCQFKGLPGPIVGHLDANY